MSTSACANVHIYMQCIHMHTYKCMCACMHACQGSYVIACVQVHDCMYTRVSLYIQHACLCVWCGQMPWMADRWQGSGNTLKMSVLQLQLMPAWGWSRTAKHAEGRPLLPGGGERVGWRLKVHGPGSNGDKPRAQMEQMKRWCLGRISGQW